MIGLGHYLNRHRGMSWRRILMLQVAALAVLFAAYSLVAPRLLASGAGDRLSFLAPHAFDPRAAVMTLGFLFGWGSFSVWGWLCAILALTLFVWRVPDGTRALAIYSVGMVLGVIYVANFTGSVQFTAEGSNLGRFLLQVTGAFLPLYCAYAGRALTPEADPPVAAKRRGARR